jgi:ankyrin repeat protein
MVIKEAPNPNLEIKEAASDSAIKEAAPEKSDDIDALLAEANKLEAVEAPVNTGQTEDDLFAQLDQQLKDTKAPKKEEAKKEAAPATDKKEEAKKEADLPENKKITSMEDQFMIEAERLELEEKKIKQARAASKEPLKKLLGEDGAPNTSFSVDIMQPQMADRKISETLYNYKMDWKAQKYAKPYEAKNDEDMSQLIFKRAYNEQNTHLPRSVADNDKKRFALNAVVQGEGDGLTSLLNMGVDADTKDDGGNTLFSRAVRHNHLDIAEILIARGAEITTPNRNLDTPMHIAVMNGNREMIRFLTKNKADLEARNSYGDTPLMIAVSTGRMKTAMDLISYGSDINTINNRGDTPLHLAAANGLPELTVALLNKGANPLVKTKAGASAKDLALSYGQVPLVRILEVAESEYKDANANYGVNTPQYLGATAMPSQNYYNVGFAQ